MGSTGAYSRAVSFVEHSWMDVVPRLPLDEQDHGHCDHPVDDAVTDDEDFSYHHHSHYLCHGVAYDALRYENDSRSTCDLDDRNEDSKLIQDVAVDTYLTLVDVPFAVVVAVVVVGQHKRMVFEVFDQLIYVMVVQLIIVSCHLHFHSSNHQEFHCFPFLLLDH